MKKNFIDLGDDPTLPISSGISLEEKYNNLSEHEKLLLAAKVGLKMNHLPADIDRFLEDPYFLGDPRITNEGKSIFQIWRKAFREIFPSPIITKYPYISLSGCVGSGKSNFSRLLGLYFYHRLDCCKNALASLGLAGGSKIAIAFFHASEQTALKDNVQVYKQFFEISPYFKNLYNNPPVRLIASGQLSTSSIIGTQLIYSVLN